MCCKNSVPFLYVLCLEYIYSVCVCVRLTDRLGVLCQILDMSLQRQLCNCGCLHMCMCVCCQSAGENIAGR